MKNRSRFYDRAFLSIPTQPQLKGVEVNLDGVHTSADFEVIEIVDDKVLRCLRF